MSVWTTPHARTVSFFFFFVHGSLHVLTRLPSRFTPLPPARWGDCRRISNTLRTKTSKHSEEKIWNLFFRLPSFPPLWFLTSCGHRVSGSSPGSKCCRSHAEISFFMNILQLPPQITFAHWLWYGCPPQQEFISCIPPPPPPPPPHASVLHPSLIVIHNNGIKTSIPGLSRIIPDFKTKDIHLGKGGTRSRSSLFSLCFVPSAPASLHFLHLALSHRVHADRRSTICGIKRRGSEEQSVSLSPKPRED